MKKRIILSLLGVLVFSLSQAQALRTAYLCLENGDIVLAHIGTCTTTVLATAPFPVLFDISEGDTADTLYGIRDDDLFFVDLTAGTVTPLGQLTVVGTTINPRFNSLVKESTGVLLAVNDAPNGELFRIDVATLTATFLGNTGFRSAGDLTFFDGDLYLSSTSNRLALIDVANPGNSSLVGTFSTGAGFNNVFGVVTVVTANPCAINPNLALVATGGDDTRFVDINTAQTTTNCTNFLNSNIFGAAEVSSDVICVLTVNIADSNGITSPEYCTGSDAVLNATVSPVTPTGTYSYEWRIQGQPAIIGTNSSLSLTNLTTSTVYECTVIDSGLAPPDNIATSTINVTIAPNPVWNPIANVVAHDMYTLPAITGTNIPANTAFFDNPAHTGTPWNTGDILDPTLFSTNPATIYVFGMDNNGCELEEQFDINFVDVQLTISPAGIQDVCAGDMVTLTATPVPATPFGNYSYNWSDTQGTTYPNTASITVTVAVATTVSVTVDDSGVVNGVGMGFDMVDFNVLSVIDVIDLTDQSVISSFTFPAITGTGLTGGEAYYTQPGGMGTMYSAGDVVTAADFTSLPVTLYIYDSNGTCDDEESFMLDIITPPVLMLSINSSDNNFCPGGSTVLTATPSPTTPLGMYSYEWREQGTTTVLSTTDTLSVSPLSTTVYECILTDSGFMTNNSVTEMFTVVVALVPDLNLIADQTATSSFTLPNIGGANLSGNEMYYTQPGGLGTSFAPGDVIDIADFATYPVTIYVYDVNMDGCNDEISFDLIINPPVVNPPVVTPEPEEPLFMIPDYITPNNDGFHDFWLIESLNTDITITGLYVFDRYGKLLKQLDPNGIGWDATYNGNPLPSSTYWYLLNYELNGLSQEMKGSFAVKR